MVRCGDHNDIDMLQVENPAEVVVGFCLAALLFFGLRHRLFTIVLPDITYRGYSDVIHPHEVVHIALPHSAHADECTDNPIVGSDRPPLPDTQGWSREPGRS